MKFLVTSNTFAVGPTTYDGLLRLLYYNRQVRNRSRYHLRRIQNANDADEIRQIVEDAINNRNTFLLNTRRFVTPISEVISQIIKEEGKTFNFIIVKSTIRFLTTARLTEPYILAALQQQGARAQIAGFINRLEVHLNVPQTDWNDGHQDNQFAHDASGALARLRPNLTLETARTFYNNLQQPGVNNAQNRAILARIMASPEVATEAIQSAGRTNVLMTRLAKFFVGLGGVVLVTGTAITIVYKYSEDAISPDVAASFGLPATVITTLVSVPVNIGFQLISGCICKCIRRDPVPVDVHPNHLDQELEEQHPEEMNIVEIHQPGVNKKQLCCTITFHLLAMIILSLIIGFIGGLFVTNDDAQW